jgi:hypothetical protein
LLADLITSALPTGLLVLVILIIRAALTARLALNLIDRSGAASDSPE